MQRGLGGSVLGGQGQHTRAARALVRARHAGAAALAPRSSGAAVGVAY